MYVYWDSDLVHELGIPFFTKSIFGVRIVLPWKIGKLTVLGDVQASSDSFAPGGSWLPGAWG